MGRKLWFANKIDGEKSDEIVISKRKMIPASERRLGKSSRGK
jgi:hypothetical protein